MHESGAASTRKTQSYPAHETRFRLPAQLCFGIERHSHTASRSHQRFHFGRRLKADSLASSEYTWRRDSGSILGLFTFHLSKSMETRKYRCGPGMNPMAGTTKRDTVRHSLQFARLVGPCNAFCMKPVKRKRALRKHNTPQSSRLRLTHAKKSGECAPNLLHPRSSHMEPINRRYL